MPKGIYIRSEEHKRKISESRKGIEFSKKHKLNISRAKRGKTINESNPNWKGDKAGYDAIHRWVYHHLGKPKECVYCGSEEWIEWASISHQAKRDLNDYIPLCAKCHRDYDNWSQKLWETRKLKKNWEASFLKGWATRRTLEAIK